MTDKTNTLNSLVHTKFQSFYDAFDTFKSLQWSDSTGGLSGVHATLPYAGDVTVVNFQYLNDHASTVRGFCSVLLYLLLLVYLMKEGPRIFGSMH